MSNETTNPSELVVYCWNSIYPYEILTTCTPTFSEGGNIVFHSSYQTTDVPPPELPGHAICRDIQHDTWVYVPDYRGKSYWTKDMTYKDCGIPILYPGALPEGAALVPPKKPSSVLRHELKLALKEKKRELRDSGIYFDKILFDSDHRAEFAYNDFFAQAKNDPSLVKRWKASDGVWVDMTKDLCEKVLPLVRQHRQRFYEWYEMKEKELAETPDELLESFTF